MKMWIGCSVLGVILLGILIYIFADGSPKANALLPKENIVFSILEDEPIYSEKNFNNRFEEYILEIKSKNNQPFINAKVACSSNVKVLRYSEQKTKMFYYFNVKEGAKISFELTTENFEKSRAVFNATPFSNSLEISFTNLINRKNQQYNLINENNSSLLYLVNDESYYGEAIKDEYPCFLNYNAMVDNNLINNNSELNAFNNHITATTSDISVLDLNLETQTIKTKKVGSASITFSYNYEDIQIVKKIDFKILNVPVNKMHNLPNSIEINMAINSCFTLSHSIEPSYATDINYLLNDDAKEIVSLYENIITAKTVGEGELVFFINSELHIINIKVINENFKKPDQEQGYVYEITLQGENEDFNYNSQTQTLNLDLTKFEGKSISMHFYVVLKSTSGTEIDPMFVIGNNNEQMLKQYQLINNNMFLLIESIKGTITINISHFNLECVETQIIINVE
ncbi:MAG: hypothetical protein PHX09_01910 [Clostridia bacterium]|nr:hypothetical protein [Clostridia bacterium]